MSTLNRYGFSPVGVDVCSFEERVPNESYHFHRFDVFNNYVDWKYKDDLIESFNIPPVGAEILTNKIENSTVVVSPLGAQGTIQGNNVIFGCRSKVSDPEEVVFSVKFYSGEVKTFFWGFEGIKEVFGMAVGVYSTSVHGSVHPVLGMNSEHPWYYFNESWLSSRTNIEFDMDGCNYVSYLRPEAYFQVKRGNYYDIEGNDYEVKEVPGMVEPEFERRIIFCWYVDGVWLYCGESRYRKRPDSKFRISLMINSMVTVDKLRNCLIIPRGHKRIKILNPTPILATQRKTYAEKVQIINDGMVPVIRDRASGTSRNACVWRFLQGRDDYVREKVEEHLRDLREIFVGNNATVSKAPVSDIMFKFGDGPSYYVSAKPRFETLWFLVYFRYVDFRDKFPKEFLVEGVTPYYRVFLSAAD